MRSARIAVRIGWALFASLACAAQSPQAPAQQQRLPRVLVYTVSAGYVHEVVQREPAERPSLVEQALIDLGRASGQFETVLSRDAADFTRANLKGFDLVLFYTTGELPFSAEQFAALLERVRDGGAFVGIHCAADTFYKRPEYGALLGAYFDGHPWNEALRVRVEDRAHPATAHLGASFEIADEIYQFKAPYDRSQLHVLLSLDTSALDVQREGVHRADRDFALAWCRDYGRGRVFYTALGHRPEVWKDARYLEHLAGGMRWAMRRTPLDAAGDAARDQRSSFIRERREFAQSHAGDPARGFQLFRTHAGAMCVRCHMVNGSGAQVGPDLSDVGARYDRKELITSVLEPSQRIAEGYRTAYFELKNGVIVSGQIKGETPAEVSLYGASGELVKLEVADIERRGTSDVSLMPDGLAAVLSPQEFTDVIEYLTTLTMPAGERRDAR